MSDGFGKIFLLILAIAVILIGTSGRGVMAWHVLTGKSLDLGGVPTPSKNPTDYDTSGGVKA